MQQLEMEFFWPLTEQTTLELDFTPSEEWIADWKKKQWGPITSNSIGNGGISSTTWSNSSITSNFVIRPSVKNVGMWEISESMFVYRPTKPNAVIRFMAKHLLGFKWHDEIQ